MKTRADMSFAIEHTGSMKVSYGPEYICNIAQRLFNMAKGSDEYNREMGLDIATRAKQPCQDGFRDNEYEADIMKQFMTYTDIIPSKVVAMFRNGILVISMVATYNGEEFTLGISSDPSYLAAHIFPKIVEPR